MGKLSCNNHPITRYLDDCRNFARHRIEAVVGLSQVDQSIRKEIAEKTITLKRNLKEAQIQINELKAGNESLRTQAHEEGSKQQDIDVNDSHSKIQELQARLQETERELDEA